MKIKVLFIIIISMLTLSLIACNDSNGYTVSLLNPNDYVDSKLNDWLENNDSTEGFYTYIYSDPASWEMYIYVKDYNKDLGYITYHPEVTIKDGTAIVTLTSRDAVNDDDVQKDILLVVTAPLRGAWPNQAQVIVDGEELEHIAE